jgi:hypothetical protein
MKYRRIHEKHTRNISVAAMKNRLLSFSFQSFLQEDMGGGNELQGQTCVSALTGDG